MKLAQGILFSFFITTNIFAAGIDANDIVKKADLRRGLGNVSHSFNVTITNQDNKKEVYHVAFKDVNASLTEQTEPERARGRKILMKDYDIWLYTTNIKKPLRISLEQKLTGEVANGDIARTNYSEDYDATLISTEKRGNAEFYKLDLKAKNKKVTYGRIEYWVSKKDSIPMEATFFALSGKPLKSAQFMDFKPVQGMSRTTKMVIRDYLQKDKMSTMVFSDHKPEKFDESLFNKDRLEF
ncbi:MAG: outer membrane lipoprotein-sorting protein [Rhizobacter sp.]|nr:outer membrane lipoprotein-sorting protein [Bacteriovorax sp.]